MSHIPYQAVPRSIRSIRDMASTVRDAIGRTGEEKTRMDEVLEFDIPRLLPGFVYHVQSRAEMGENHGLASPDQDYIIIRSDVYAGARRDNGRDRFTIAHELGHLILHQRENLLMRRGTGPVPILACPERQANTFAAEFLMDHRQCELITDPLKLARRFAVSEGAAERRIRALARERSPEVKQRPGGVPGPLRNPNHQGRRT